jgi:hypothetical protein
VVKIIHVYNDPDGESHIRDVELPVTERSTGGTDISRFAETVPATEMVLREVVHNNDKVEFHHPAARQFVVHLSGEAEIETSDGDVRRIRPGDILFAEDMVGRGHKFKPLGSSPRMTIFVRVPEGWRLPVSH